VLINRENNAKLYLGIKYLAIKLNVASFFRNIFSVNLTFLLVKPTFFTIFVD